MTEQPEQLSPVDVIRCVYLAREAARRGDTETAARWTAMAERWLNRRRPRVLPDPDPDEPNGTSPAITTDSVLRYPF